MEIYNLEFKKTLKNKIIRNSLFCGGVSLVLIAGIVVPMVLFNHSFRIVYEGLTILSCIALIYYAFLSYKLRFKWYLNLYKRIKANEIATKSIINATFKEIDTDEQLINGVVYYSYLFDNDTKLYIEKSIANPFEKEKKYELTLVDNYILEYKEVI